jgi:hypothetical protein
MDGRPPGLFLNPQNWPLLPQNSALPVYPWMAQAFDPPAVDSSASPFPTGSSSAEDAGMLLASLHPNDSEPQTVKSLSRTVCRLQIVSRQVGSKLEAGKSARRVPQFDTRKILMAPVLSLRTGPCMQPVQRVSTAHIRPGQ